MPWVQAQSLIGLPDTCLESQYYSESPQAVNGVRQQRGDKRRTRAQAGTRHPAGSWNGGAAPACRSCYAGLIAGPLLDTGKPTNHRHACTSGDRSRGDVGSRPVKYRLAAAAGSCIGSINRSLLA
jgi:hypothetical protein